MISYILEVCRAAEAFRLAKHELVSSEGVVTRAGTCDISNKIREARRHAEEARLRLHDLMPRLGRWRPG